MTAHLAQQTGRGTGRTATYPHLAGKVVVVTGGSRGLGAATCRALAANDAKVVVNGRDNDAIDGVVAELRDIGAEAIPAAAGTPADESLQGPDGVHPSIVGQAAITRALVTRLTSTGKATGT